MKEKLMLCYKNIVGQPYGFSGEGNELWYYFIALVINCMLTWWVKPESGIVFTIATVLHCVMICVYGAIDFYDCSIWCSVGYWIIHIAIFVVCMVFNWKWTLLTSVVVVLLYFLAPDETGNNIFMRPPKVSSVRTTIIYLGNKNTKLILLFHTIVFIIFVVIALNLPISFWLRIGIVLVCMLLHPIIDIIQGEGICVSDVTMATFSRVINYFKYSTKG